MAIIGSRWSAVIFAAALLGTRRFSDFEREIGISPTLLSERLRGLESVGVLERRKGPGGGRQREYRLTEKGIGFYPVVAMLVDWAERWFGDPAEPTLSIVHRDCGRPFEPELTCDGSGRHLERRELRWEGSATPQLERLAGRARGGPSR